MISMAAHRAVLATVPRREYPLERNSNTARGKGAHQHPAMLLSSRRYKMRQAGKISPLEYGTLDQACEALR